jgi:hypothetical protein
MGLLQLCAAVVGTPLIVFTSAQPTLAPPLEPAGLGISISGEHDQLMSNPVDVDIWLGFRAGTSNGKHFTNREIIAAIGNTRASHVARDLHPYVVTIESIRSGISGEQESLLVRYITRVAAAIVPAAREILSR